MGMVFGKITVEEPPHQVLLTRPSAATAYEIRRYGERFAAEADYPKDDSGNDKSPFGVLARYIGVFGTPENEGSEPMAMTAPVVMQDSGGTKMAMTAPVVMSDSSSTKTMQFMLPAQYDSLDKIPTPTNPAVRIRKLSPGVGAVHKFHGTYDMARCRRMALSLVQQLKQDGLEELEETEVLQKFEFWGYNPPFTIPYFRRNEVWIPLSEEQVSRLMNDFDPAAAN